MSKFGRKLSHLFSALVLLLSVFVALPGLAKADTDTAPETINLTINGTTSDFKYNGYRIMTAEVNKQDKNAVKYTLNGTYEKAVLDAAHSVDSSVTDFASFKTFLKKNEKSANSTTGETSDMRKFAYKLSQIIQTAKLEPDKTFSGGDNADNTVDVGKEAGYYLLVDATANSTANPHNYSATLLTGLVNKDVTLNVKPITPIVHKKVLDGDTNKYVDATDYAAGDTIPFMITGTISSQIKLYNEYKYYFTDTLPKGLTLEKDKDKDRYSIDVQAEKVTSGYAKGINATNATKLKEGTDWEATVTTDKKDGTTSLTVNLNNLKKLVEDGKISAEDTIVVTYKAKLNDDAVIGGDGNVNNVQLHYTNNPDNGDEGQTNSKNAKVYTYELDVKKVTGDKDLAGAGFTLYKEDANGEYKAANGKSYKVVKEIKPDDAVADPDSEVKNKYLFKELDQGEYMISETTVPKGYHKADDVYFKITATFEGQNTAGAHLETLKVEDNNSFTANKDSGIVSTNVNNVSDKGFVLPSTGGMGRYIFLAVGALVVVAAVAFPSLKKKKLQ